MWRRKSKFTIWKSGNIIHQIYRYRKKFISINTKKTFDKIQHLYWKSLASKKKKQAKRNINNFIGNYERKYSFHKIEIKKRYFLTLSFIIKLEVWDCIKAAAAPKLHQSCLTLCNPIDSSPPGSSIFGIHQARTLEWVAISFSSAWKWKMRVKLLSRVRLFDPMDCSLPGSSNHGISKARVLEWVVIAFSHIKANN